MELLRDSTDVDLRDAARRQFALDVDSTARAAAWTDEQAAVALTGFPCGHGAIGSRSAAFAATHGIVRAAARNAIRRRRTALPGGMVHMGEAERKGPALALRDAVERATREASASEADKPRERTSDSRRTRRDRLADELRRSSGTRRQRDAEPNVAMPLCARRQAGKAASPASSATP